MREDEDDGLSKEEKRIKKLEAENASLNDRLQKCKHFAALDRERYAAFEQLIEAGLTGLIPIAVARRFSINPPERVVIEDVTGLERLRLVRFTFAAQEIILPESDLSE